MVIGGVDGVDECRPRRSGDRPGCGRGPDGRCGRAGCPCGRPIVAHTSSRVAHRSSPGHLPVVHRSCTESSTGPPPTRGRPQGCPQLWRDRRTSAGCCGQHAETLDRVLHRCGEECGQTSWTSPQDAGGSVATGPDPRRRRADGLWMRGVASRGGVIAGRGVAGDGPGGGWATVRTGRDTGWSACRVAGQAVLGVRDRARNPSAGWGDDRRGCGSSELRRSGAGTGCGSSTPSPGCTRNAARS